MVETQSKTIERAAGEDPSADLASLMPLLRCPQCRSVLKHSPVRCSNPSCDARAGFLTSKGQPVLIAFQRSIFTPEIFTAGGGTVLPRGDVGTRAGRWLRRLTFGRDPTPARVVSELLQRLRSKGANSRVLVIGGGSIGKGLEELYADSRIELVGTDVYASEHTILVCDAHDLPFADESFDAVVIQAVLEHVLDPARVADEIHRVLKFGGLVYADTPFMQQVHEGAYDFTRFSMSGHRWLFRRFDELESGIVGGPGLALLWSLSYYLRSLGAAPKLVALLTAPFFWVRLLDRFADPARAADAASGVYFVGCKRGNELAANIMPSVYGPPERSLSLEG